MNEKTLLKLALVAGVIGLLILFIIAELKNIPENISQGNIALFVK